MLGALGDVTKRNETGVVVSVSSTKISAVNYSFCPKFILVNKNDDGSGSIQILPKYTFSNIHATGYTFTRNSNNLSQPIEEKKKVSSSQHSFGIGVGYVVDFEEDNSQSIALNLYLSNVNLGKAFNKWETDNTLNTQYVIGVGVNYYFSLKKKTI